MSTGSVAFLTNDLIFSSRLGALAREAGIDLRVVLQAGQVADLAKESRLTGVLVDLEVTGLDFPALFAALPDRTAVTVIAYGSHVHEARLAAARAAGCDQVLTRGKFNHSMGDVLRRLSEA